MIEYEEIEPYPIGRVKANDIAIVCIGKGLIPLMSKEGQILCIETLYSAEVEGIIISPTTMVQQHTEQYQSDVLV